MAAPDKLTIDTPEQIALEYTLAGPGSRFLALAVDTLAQALAFVVLLLLAGAARPSFGAAWAVWIQAAILLAVFAILYGYFAVFEIVWNGQTPGKRLVNLRVISATGRPITAFDAIIRNLLRIVDSLPGIYAVGMVSMFLTERSQRLGDLAAGTVVVHEAPVERGELYPAPDLAASAPPLGAARLDPREIEVMETFLRRRGELPDESRERSASELAEHVRHRLGLAPDQESSDERLLERLVGEYRKVGKR